MGKEKKEGRIEKIKRMKEIKKKEEKDSKPDNSKPSSADAIDAIFKAAKKKPARKPIKEDGPSKQLKKQWRQQQKVRKETGDLTCTRIQNGLKIYNEEQLKIGQGGNTPKCPIDCDCCF